MKVNPKPPRPQLQFEKSLRKRGYKLICGLDEAGRGAWAGPLVCAAVILKADGIVGLDDSKRLSRQKREDLFGIILHESTAVGWAFCEVEQINRNGIQTATYLGFNRAIAELAKEPDHLLIDHYSLPGTLIPQLSITFGDQISQSIAAASIVAKVIRDRKMLELSRQDSYKSYNFKRNFGYGTKDHEKLIKQLGIASQHRLKFCHEIIQDQLQANLF